MRILILLSLLFALPASAGWTDTPDGTVAFTGPFQAGNRYYHQFTDATDSSLGDTNQCGSSQGQYKDITSTSTVNFDTCEAPNSGVVCDPITSTARSDGEGFVLAGPMGFVRCSVASGTGTGLCTFYCGN